MNGHERRSTHLTDSYTPLASPECSSHRLAVSLVRMDQSFPKGKKDNNNKYHVFLVRSTVLASSYPIVLLGSQTFANKPQGSAIAADSGGRHELTFVTPTSCGADPRFDMEHDRAASQFE